METQPFTNTRLQPRQSLRLSEGAPSAVQRNAARDIFLRACLAVDWHRYAPDVLEGAFAEEVEAGAKRHWLLAHSNDTLVGFCTYESTSPRAYVAQMAVDPNA